MCCALTCTGSHPVSICHQCQISCEHAVNPRYLSPETPKSSPPAFPTVLLFVTRSASISPEGLMCSPSSDNKLRQPVASTVGWVSYFSRLTEVICSAQPSSAQIQRQQHTVGSGLTAGTHTGLEAANTHTHTLNIFTSADMMHAAFLLLFAFTGKTLCCRCMIFQFFFSRVRDRKVLVTTSIVLHSVYIWCVNYLIPSKCCHRVTSVQIYLKPKMVKSVHLFFSFIVFSEAEGKPVVHLKEEKQKLSSYCSIYT